MKTSHATCTFTKTQKGKYILTQTVFKTFRNGKFKTPRQECS